MVTASGHQMLMLRLLMMRLLGSRWHFGIVVVSLIVLDGDLLTNTFYGLLSTTLVCI